MAEPEQLLGVAAAHMLALAAEQLTAVAEVGAPNTRDIIVYLVLLSLTGDRDLAQYFLVDRCRRRGPRTQRTAVPELSDSNVAEFLELPGVGRAVARAVPDLANQYRISADTFLVNSMLAAFVLKQSQKGVIVPTGLAIETYLALWADRDHAPKTRSWLTTLMHQKTARRNFAALMRSQWCFQWGAFKERKEVEDGARRRKVSD